ncbi:DNA-J related domain-containing protein [Reinekea marinisedimentorum]|uniref:DnaJ-like protein n=1 Tax=Reinekea marinisedimentorum TaxID=230495 RepID=A0A4R3I325_9GAMM|nr:DNA-J related domain-containing protein [Reinekea marinisedimentorum]TCS40188.1 DnaJ-like protein [Reinekea marinisedimentorum]
MKNLNLDRRLMLAIEALICHSTDGITEFELINRLNEMADSPYPKPNLADPLILFQHHFYLRHCLYVLQNEWLRDQRGFIEITAVTIRILPMTRTENNLPGHTDPLKDYYLDLANMNRENAASVQGMLDHFWQQLARFHAKPEALAVLGLSGNETADAQKQHYRALVQQHHPDKGGCEEKFRAIQAAWESLSVHKKG